MCFTFQAPPSSRRGYPFQASRGWYDECASLFQMSPSSRRGYPFQASRRWYDECLSLFQMPPSSRWGYPFQASRRRYAECVSPFRCRRVPGEATLFRLAGEVTDERMKTMLRPMWSTSWYLFRYSLLRGKARLTRKWMWQGESRSRASWGAGRVRKQESSYYFHKEEEIFYDTECWHQDNMFLLPAKALKIYACVSLGLMLW